MIAWHGIPQARSDGAESFGVEFWRIVPGRRLSRGDESDCIRTVHVSLEKGINFIDTSPFYGLTKSETVLGKALKRIPRDRYILSRPKWGDMARS